MAKQQGKLGAKLREEALAHGGRVGLAVLLENLVPVAELRAVVQEHGLSTKGFRVEKAPAKVLAPILAEPYREDVLEQVCKMLEGYLLPKDAPAAPAPEATPAADLGPVLKLKEQALEEVRQDLEKCRATAQALRDRADEQQRLRKEEAVAATRLGSELAEVQAALRAAQATGPAPSRDLAQRVETLTRELDEQAQVELQQRKQIAELAMAVREREVRIEEVEEELDSIAPMGRKKRRKLPPAAPTHRFSVPNFTPGFLKSLAGRDRRTIEATYRAVFFYCTEGPSYPGLAAKSLEPAPVWSLRASQKLRVFIRPREDGDVDVLELIDREEQDTALRRYRERS